MDKSNVERLNSWWDTGKTVLYLRRLIKEAHKAYTHKCSGVINFCCCMYCCAKPYPCDKCGFDICMDHNDHTLHDLGCGRSWTR